MDAVGDREGKLYPDLCIWFRLVFGEIGKGELSFDISIGEHKSNAPELLVLNVLLIG